MTAAERLSNLAQEAERLNQRRWDNARKALDAARDSFFERLTDKLPRYQIPETASLFARGLHWPDVEDAHILPDGRLLVRWEDCTMPEVLTEAEYLSTIAHRSEWIGDFADDPDSLYNHVLNLARRNP